MDLQNAKKHIKITEIIAEDLSEQALDCDLLLPDYLPDIAVILKCVTQPTVQNYQLSGDRIMAEGIVKVQMLYLSEERDCVHTFEMMQPFGCTFRLNEVDSNPLVRVTAKNNYTNCRAISPRRADVHGTFSVKMSMYGEKEKTVVDLAPEKAFQTKCETVSFSRLIGSKAKSFTVNETLELANTVDANTLIRSSVVPQVTECKAIKNKAIIKGDLLLCNVFSVNGEGGKLGRAENVIPFSQIVDLEGLEEESQCICRATVLHCEAHPAQTPVGENKLLAVSVKINLDFSAFQTEQMPLLIDAYHTDHPTKSLTTPLEFCHIAAMENCTDTQTVTLALADKDIDTIEDLWCEIESVSTDYKNGERNVCVQTAVCILGRDSKTGFSFLERSAEFWLALPQSADRAQTEVKITKTEWKRVGAEWELQVTFTVDICFVNAKTLPVVTEMQIDEHGHCSSKEGKECVKIYFASQGETVWEIGKKYHVLMESICRENDVTEDEVLKKDTMIVLTP